MNVQPTFCPCPVNVERTFNPRSAPGPVDFECIFQPTFFPGSIECGTNLQPTFCPGPVNVDRKLTHVVMTLRAHQATDFFQPLEKGLAWAKVKLLPETYHNSLCFPSHF
jgi:hypothetical protein